MADFFDFVKPSGGVEANFLPLVDTPINDSDKANYTPVLVVERVKNQSRNGPC